MAATVAVLGGLGLMAEASLHDLAASPAVTQILAADLNVARKGPVLSRIAQRRKIRVLAVDLNDTPKAARAMKGADIVINASWYEFNLKAMDLSLALGAHYIDLGGLYHMTLQQLKRRGEFDKAGLLAVLGCGSTPGITNMMTAALEMDFKRIDAVAIYDASHDPSLSAESFLPPFSIRTMLDEYVMPAPILENGRMVEAPAHSRPDALEFPAPIGRCSAGTVIHSETATLPAYLKTKGVKNMAFKIVYPELIKSQLAMLVGMGLSEERALAVNGVALSPRRFLTALAQRGAVQASGKPCDFEVLRVRMTGAGAAGTPLTREWDCEMRPTRLLTAGAMGVGFTASIVASMILDGELKRRSGAFAPESCLKISDFFRKLLARKVFRIVERTERPLQEPL